MKKRSRILSLVLSLIMIISLLPTAAFADDAVVTNAADLDVFMNIDKSVADATEFKNDVSTYLQWLIQNGGKTEIKNFRINTTSATIDPTDITKWHVYSHYDKVWYSNEDAWKASYNGGVIPAYWFYTPVMDTSTANGTFASGKYANAKTTIADMLSDKAGTSSYGTAWGKAAGLQSHIYPFMDNNNPAMVTAVPAIRGQGYTG